MKTRKCVFVPRLFTMKILLLTRVFRGSFSRLRYPSCPPGDPKRDGTADPPQMRTFISPSFESLIRHPISMASFKREKSLTFPSGRGIYGGSIERSWALEAAELNWEMDLNGVGMKETRMESIHQGLDLFPFLNYDDLLTIHRITKFIGNSFFQL